MKLIRNGKPDFANFGNDELRSFIESISSERFPENSKAALSERQSRIERGTWTDRSVPFEEVFSSYSSFGFRWFLKINLPETKVMKPNRWLNHWRRFNLLGRCMGVGLFVFGGCLIFNWSIVNDTVSWYFHIIPGFSLCILGLGLMFVKPYFRKP